MKVLDLLLILLIVVIVYVVLLSVNGMFKTKSKIGSWDFEEVSFASSLMQEQANSRKAAYDIIKTLQDNDGKIATAESLTAGLMFSTLVDLPFGGWHKYGCFGVYDTDAKRKFLGVTVDDVYTHECAKQMAEGVLKNSNASIALAVTGHAMPWKGAESELGKVHVGVAAYNKQGEIITKTQEIAPNNSTIDLWKQRPGSEKIISEKLQENNIDLPQTKDLEKLQDSFNDIQLTAQIAQYVRYFTTTQALNICNNFLHENNSDIDFYPSFVQDNRLEKD